MSNITFLVLRPNLYSGPCGIQVATEILYVGISKHYCSGKTQTQRVRGSQLGLKLAPCWARSSWHPLMQSWRRELVVFTAIWTTLFTSTARISLKTMGM